MGQVPAFADVAEDAPLVLRHEQDAERLAITGLVKNPRTGALVPPTALDGRSIVEETDPSPLTPLA